MCSSDLAAMLAGYIMAISLTSRAHTVVDLPESDTLTELRGKLPSGWKALLPIVLPIVLIGIRSFATFPSQPFGEGWVYHMADFAGHPIQALSLGFVSSFLLFPRFNQETLTNWVGQGISAAAPILLITGAGGAFGAVLKETQIADTLGIYLSEYQLGIFLPFVIAAVFKTAQGSSTVALVAASALVAPMLPSLGLDSVTGATLAVLATGAGSMIVSHANDSYFWVVTQFSGMEITTGYRAHTLTTLVQGLTAMAIIWILYIIL